MEKKARFRGIFRGKFAEKLACSKRSDSGERCRVKKAMKSRGGLGREVTPLLLPRFYFFALPFTPHRSPLSERLEQATEKSADFAGFSRGKSPNSWKNRPISWDFRGKKVKLRGTISRFRGILAEKSQFSKNFQGQILRKIGRFHGKFRGETSPRNNQ